MNIFSIVLIAIGLAMDAFAVSIANGLIIKKKKYFNAFKFGVSFGLFQMVMPIMGWSLGYRLKDLIQNIDHWIAFFLLGFIGVKMIYESFKIEKIEKDEASITLSVLLGLSVATSIDALAVGLSFAFLEVSIVVPVLIIGGVTFVLSYLGVLIGNRFGPLFEKKMEIIGGLILIGIGFKILIEHLM